MHLAYFDDSDTKSKRNKWQVMSAVIVEDSMFKLAEMGVSSLVEDLIPYEKREQFEEFHACELYGGYGVFEGIDEFVRLEAIQKLLVIVSMSKLPIVYGGVNLSSLKREVYASADPMDICFRMCLKGLEEWADLNLQLCVERDLEAAGGVFEAGHDKLTETMIHNMMEQLVMLVMDDCAKQTKETLHKSFREFRPPCRQELKMHTFHDDMYFGDSRYSIGIQLADLCSYFIARHLNEDLETESFYEIIKNQIAYGQIHPPIPEGQKLEKSAKELSEKATEQPGV